MPTAIIFIRFTGTTKGISSLVITSSSHTSVLDRKVLMMDGECTMIKIYDGFELAQAEWGTKFGFKKDEKEVKPLIPIPISFTRLTLDKLYSMLLQSIITRVWSLTIIHGFWPRFEETFTLSHLKNRRN